MNFHSFRAPLVAAGLLLSHAGISAELENPAVESDTIITEDQAIEAAKEELNLLQRALASANANDLQGAEVALLAPGKGEWKKTSASLLLARRAATLCGSLRNRNDYARAEKLTRRVIAKLEKMTEPDDFSRADRLFWEAWLQGEVLEDYTRAVELLKIAERLNPADERNAEHQLRYVAKLEFQNEYAARRLPEASR